MCPFLFCFVIILLFSWKLHTGINRSSRSSLGHHPRLQNENVEKEAARCESAEVVQLGHHHLWMLRSRVTPTH